MEIITCSLEGFAEMWAREFRIFRRSWMLLAEVAESRTLNPKSKPLNVNPTARGYPSGPRFCGISCLNSKPLVPQNVAKDFVFDAPSVHTTQKRRTGRLEPIRPDLCSLDQLNVL